MIKFTRNIGFYFLLKNRKGDYKMIEFDPSTSRRLPVYLVLDTSGSMMGDGIEAVNQGVQLLLTELKKDAMALETAYVSCISFNDQVTEVLPLTEIGQALIPPLSAGGSTNLGGALKLLLNKIQNEVRPNSPTQKGDWKPMVFIMSDGHPTDDQWQAVAAEIREQSSRKTANVIALGCGSNVDSNALKLITSVVLLMPDMTPDNIRSFFKWVSQSVKVVSQKAVEGHQLTGDAGAILPAPPPGIQIVL